MIEWAKWLTRIGIHLSRRKLAAGPRTTNGQIHSVHATHTLLGIQILGTGSYLPEWVVSNRDLQGSHGFDPDWIVNRTGIHERRFALPHQATSDLCTQAAIRCLQGGRPGAGETWICWCSRRSRPIWRFRPRRTWCRISSSWSVRRSTCRPRARDLSSPWSSRPSSSARGIADVRWWWAAIAIAGSSIPATRRVSHCSATAPAPSCWRRASPIRDWWPINSARMARAATYLSRPACGSRIPPSAAALEQGLHYLTMDGRAVFKWAVRILADSSLAVLAHAGCQVRDIRWFIPHQANVRIIHAATDVLGFHRDTVFKNLERYGNTSAGSIPIALDELHRQGGIERGDLLLTSGFGAGLNWGTALWRW